MPECRDTPLGQIVDQSARPSPRTVRWVTVPQPCGWKAVGPPHVYRAGPAEPKKRSNCRRPTRARNKRPHWRRHHQRRCRIHRPTPRKAREPGVQSSPRKNPSRGSPDRPPTEHSRRDIRYSSEYRDVKRTVDQSFDAAEVGQLLGRRKRWESIEFHAVSPSLPRGLRPPLDTGHHQEARFRPGSFYARSLRLELDGARVACRADRAVHEALVPEGLWQRQSAVLQQHHVDRCTAGFRCVCLGESAIVAQRAELQLISRDVGFIAHLGEVAGIVGALDVASQRLPGHRPCALLDNCPQRWCRAIEARASRQLPRSRSLRTPRCLR